MRIMHVLLSDRAWGIVGVVTALTRLQSRRHKVWVAGNQDLEQYLSLDPHARYLPLPISFDRGWPSMKRMAAMADRVYLSTRKLELLEKELGIDVVHFHLPNALTLTLSHRTKSKCVYTVHGEFFEDRALKRLQSVIMPMVLGRKEFVTAISRAALKPNWLLGRARIIPNGVDSARILSRSLEDDPSSLRVIELKKKGFWPIILFPGSLISRNREVLEEG